MALPDLIEIVPLDKPVRAEITVPGSKSITNRALVLAALADGEVTLEGALWSEDTQIMVECLQELGFMVNVAPDPNEFCNRTITVYGKGGKIPNGGTEQNPLELFVGNAGTAARFLSAMVCLGNGVYRLHGVPRMHERPQAALFKALRELGYRVESENGNDKLPARIFGGAQARFPLPARDERGEGQGEGRQKKTTSSPRPSPPLGEEREKDLVRSALRSCTVSIEESSQFASALMLCARIGGWDVKVTGENAEESPYVAMTQILMNNFPMLSGKYWIEPDASSSSYIKAAAWLFAEPVLNLSTGIFAPFITVPEPDPTLQVDRRFHDYFRKFRGIRHLQDTSREQVSISRVVDLGDSIMTAIVMAPFTEDVVRFTDLGRLRMQETERVVALRTELTKCGAKVVEGGDTLTVYPSQLHGAEIETYNDHRIAMCFAILGLKVPGIKLKNPACVKKTFPNFFQKLASPLPHGLGATILDANTRRKLAVEELFAD